jgi:hypothetical protein
VTQTCSIDIAREIDRRWKRRSQAATPRAAQNGDRLCPVCKEYSSIGPLAAEYCGDGLVRRHWLCRACGHDWVTMLHVLT